MAPGVQVLDPSAFEASEAPLAEGTPAPEFFQSQSKVTASHAEWGGALIQCRAAPPHLSHNLEWTCLS